MRLTVLGNASRYLAPLSAGSSYLVEHEGSRVLLDAGHGAREALIAARIEAVDAVWISHFHFDHCLDLATLPLAKDTPILIPRGERARLDALAQAYVWGRGGWSLGNVREVDEGDRLELAGLRWSFARTRHSAPSLGVRLDAEGGDGAEASFVYASDSAPCDGLQSLARDADVLLMHALLADVEADAEHPRIHSTARTAGALASQARARALLLSHRYHGSLDEDVLLEAQRSGGGVDIALARTGQALSVNRSGA